MFASVGISKIGNEYQTYRYFAVVINVFDASVETLSIRGVLPMVKNGIEVLYVSTADLQRRIDVQVLVERRYHALSLARRIVELRMGTVFEFGNVSRTTVVDHQTDVLNKKTNK